jgi:predicted RNase H-like HicB family nuclease
LRKKSSPPATADKYLVVVEKSRTGFSAYSPDVLGCIATGRSFERTMAKMKSALSLHLKAMLADGEKLPKPGGVQSYLQAEKYSEGEEYFIAHVDAGNVLPRKINSRRIVA